MACLQKIQNIAIVSQLLDDCSPINPKSRVKDALSQLLQVGLIFTLIDIGTAASWHGSCSVNAMTSTNCINNTRACHFFAASETLQPVLAAHSCGKYIAQGE